MMNEMQFADPEWRPGQGQNGSYAELEPQPYNPRLINDDHPQPEQQQWEETPERVYKAQELPPYQTPPYQAPPVMSSAYQYGQTRLRRRRNPWVWLIAILIVLSMLGGVVGRFGESSSDAGFWHKGYPAQQVRFEQPQSFSVGFEPTIVINDAGGGNIQVQGGNQGLVTVQTDGQKPGVSQSSDTLNINVTDSGDISVTVPATANLVITITAGDGDVTVDNVVGQMTLTSGSGDITMHGSTLTGNSTIKSDDGDITFDGQLDPSGSYQFISANGSVHLSLPANSAFSLNAAAPNGSIDAPDFSSVQVQPTENGATAHGNVGSAPRATLTITTDSGDISLSSH